MNPLHPRMLCAKFGWNWPIVSGEEDFENSLMYFCNFVIISPLKKAGTFISTNWNRCHLKMLCAKFGGNWLSCSGEDFLNSSMYLHFCNYLPLEKGRALNLKKFESPSFKDALCQVCLKLAQWFWRRRRKCESLGQQRRRTTDKLWSLFSLAQVS